MTCLYFNSRDITQSLIGSFLASDLRLVQEVRLLCHLHFTKHDRLTMSAQPVRGTHTIRVSQCFVI